MHVLVTILGMRAVVVAQLVQRSLLTPDVRSLNPVIGKLLYWFRLRLPLGRRGFES